jgi:hypothetical protein
VPVGSVFVPAFTAKELVSLPPVVGPINKIVAIPAIDDILARTSVQPTDAEPIMGVVAVAPLDHVVATFTVHLFSAWPAADHVVARLTPTGRYRLVAQHEVVTRSTVHMVASGSSPELVPVGLPQERIFTAAAYGPVPSCIAEGVPSPAGDPASWARTQIKRLILEDVYRPHTIEEFRALGAREEVIASLGEGDVYGVWFYNRRDVTSERVRENGEYRKTSTYKLRDRSGWVAVPIPDAGVPLEHVQKARAAVEGNASPSKAAGWEWELSGKIARCRVCDSTMRTRTRARDNGGEPLLYYVCSKARNDEGPRPCTAKRNHRAEALETEVVALVDGELLADRETLERWRQRPGASPG